MNRVANIEGKGRDDLTINILIKAENVIRKVSVNNSKSIRSLAEGVSKSFNAFRNLLKKYAENIEIVDPQLKNNSDLVDNLMNFESCWEKAKEFLLMPDNYSRLIYFSQLIEIISEKYNPIKEMIENRDPTIFVSIPGLLILKCLEGEDMGICQEYNPSMFSEESSCFRLFTDLKNIYTNLSGCIEAFSLYNNLEQLILLEDEEVRIDDLLKTKKNTLEMFTGKIKSLSMNLQREKPSEWNSFFDLAMSSMQQS